MLTASDKLIVNDAARVVGPSLHVRITNRRIEQDTTMATARSDAMDKVALR